MRHCSHNAINFWTTKSILSGCWAIYQVLFSLIGIVLVITVSFKIHSICIFSKCLFFFLRRVEFTCREGNGTPLQSSCLENPMDGGAWWAAVHEVAKSLTRLSDFTFTFHFHALEKEMATHSSVPAWRIPGTGEPGGLLSMGSCRVGHKWSDLAAAAEFTWARKLPWRRAWQPTPIFLPGESHGQRSLVGYSPWSHKESDMNEQLPCSHNIKYTSFYFFHLFLLVGG